MNEIALLVFCFVFFSLFLKYFIAAVVRFDFWLQRRDNLDSGNVAGDLSSAEVDHDRKSP